MTGVEFHTGITDKVRFTCRLLRKAYRQGARVVVTGPAPQLATLDRELWTFAERDFIPHLRWMPGVDSARSTRTPIWLVDGDVPDGAPGVLVNLGAPAPSEPARFERIIEVLSTDVDDLQPGRERWRAYLAAGLRPVRHDAPGETPA